MNVFLQQWKQTGIHIRIDSALSKYMSHEKVFAFMLHMVPMPRLNKDIVRQDPAVYIKKLAELVKSLNMESEMHLFMTKPSKIHAEIARQLCLYAQTASANRLERLRTMEPTKLSGELLDFWTNRIQKAIHAARDAREEEEGGAQDKSGDEVSGYL